MQLTDNNGNIFGANGLEVTGPDGKPKTISGGGSPTGPAGGDLSGTYPNPSVVWNNGTSTYNSLYYPLSSNPGGYLTSAVAASIYQPILTLTTTGTSGPATLVGSTLNIPQYSGGGGGGLAGVQNMLGNLQGTGSAFGITAALTASNNSTYTTTAGRLDVYPFIPNKSLVNCSLSINVTTLGAGVLSRVVIYGDTNGFPGAKLYESTDIDCSTTGTKTLLANFTFNAGVVYWLGLYSNGVTSMTGILSSALLPIFAAFANGIPANSWSRINTNLGTAPNPFQYNTYRNGAMPTIWIKPT